MFLGTGACVTTEITLLSSGGGFSYVGLSKKDLIHVFHAMLGVKHQYITGCDITLTFSTLADRYTALNTSLYINRQT